MRTLIVWCPDWPVTAAGYGCDDAVVVVGDRRVIAASGFAREKGVRRGMRQREAERHCPGIVVLRRDPTQEARHFVPIVDALNELSTSIELLRPGLCALDAHAMSRYFGGEVALCALVQKTAEEAISLQEAPNVRVGIAEGVFAAILAARRQLIVKNRKTPEFLAPLPITALGKNDLVEALLLLGILTLGAFSELPESLVSARFGQEGLLAHRRARGEEGYALCPTPPREHLDEAVGFESPVVRVDMALFAARSTAARFIDKLTNRGMGCAVARIEVETEHGEVLCRRWRSEFVFDADALVVRLRWQLDGWLSATTSDPAPTAGLVAIRFYPEEVVRLIGEPLRLFGGKTENDRRAARGGDRLVGMLGPQSVFTGAVVGGRAPAERSFLVPWGEVLEKTEQAPWPGHQPIPAPSVIYPTPVPLVVSDGTGFPVTVSARGEVSSPPALIEVLGERPYPVVDWSGPFLYDERFWDASARRRCARFQIALEDGSAHLCFIERAQWFLEASYD